MYIFYAVYYITNNRMYKLQNWIIQNKINWGGLSRNPSDGAIELLKQNQDEIDWEWLSCNTNDGAIELLKKNQNVIDWDGLSRNSNDGAIELLKKNRIKFIGNICQ